MGIKEIIYKNQSFEYHYKTNPYTYKLRKGKLLIPKNEIKIEEGIKSIVNKL